MASFLPPTIWSMSSCLCTTYPDIWVLPWVTTAVAERDAIQIRLGLSAPDFAAMQAWVDTAFNEQRFGWPNVWLDLASAQHYYQRYLLAIPRIKLLAIALPAPYLDAFLSEAVPEPGSGPHGLYQMVVQRQKLPESERVLGFEILGAEYGGISHSFLCNHLETAYQQQLNLRLNEHGLLASYDDARRAADFTNLDTTGAEPVPWYPWLVVDYTLSTTPA
jgi:hypothetical protein